MASLAAQGHRVVLVTATRGELGEVADGYLDPGETLAERREVELAEAAAVLGVARLDFLGYHDSGMEGEDSTDDPDSFATADLVEAAGRLADPAARRPPTCSSPTTSTGATATRTTSRSTTSGWPPPTGPAPRSSTCAPWTADFMSELRRRAAESGLGTRRDRARGRRHHGRARGADHHRGGRTALDRPPRRRHAAHASQIDRGELLPVHARGHVRRGLGPGVVHPGHAPSRSAWATGSARTGSWSPRTGR